MNAILLRLVTAARARLRKMDPAAIAELSARVAPARRDPLQRPSFSRAIVGKDRVSLIAEFKRRSPSEGAIAPGVGLGDQLQAYVDGGAAAVSVLTEASDFGGCYEDFVEAGRCCALPLLMKDFFVDPRQVECAAQLGASAVLLIARCVAQDAALQQELLAAARAHELEVLYECHSLAEVEAALGLEAVVIGVNNRDLDTMDVDVARAAAFLPRIPAGRICVAESGYRSLAQLEALRGSADAALVGTALMRGEFGLGRELGSVS